MNTIHLAKYESPVGTLLLGSFADRLIMCDWCAGGRSEATLRKLSAYFSTTSVSYTSSENIVRATAELDEYFRGERKGFGVPLLFSGTTFRHQVMEQLQSIPYGETISYIELARRVGRPRAVRATATAVASNPLSIFLPCHRVVASNGALAGYAGGLEAKKKILQLEKALEVV